MTFITEDFAIRRSAHGGFTEVWEFVSGSPVFISAFFGRNQAINWITRHTEQAEV